MKGIIVLVQTHQLNITFKNNVFSSEQVQKSVYKNVLFLTHECYKVNMELNMYFFYQSEIAKSDIHLLSL